MEDEEQRKGMSKKVSLKLLIDTKEKRVLYGEADNKFIDFLFTILALPVGTVVKLLSTEAMVVGSSSSLLRSIDALNDIDYFEPNRHAHNLLKPNKYYSCSNNHNHHDQNFSATYGTQCPHCSISMIRNATYVHGSDEARPIGGGYVKEGMFMVMDDLTVKPMSCSSISVVSILNELNVKDIGHIQEEVVHFDINQGVKLLKASEYSVTVLTDVFLRRIDFSKHYVSIVKKE